jgi:hypothetical protein
VHQEDRLLRDGFFYIVISSGEEETTSRRHEHKSVKSKFNHILFNYSRICRNLNAQLLCIPRGRPSHFDVDEDYLWWSHKMCSHLFPLHPSIFDIVKWNANII